MSIISLNFNDQTYSKASKPTTATLSADLTSIETGVNDNNSRLTTVEGAYVAKDGSVDFTAKQSYSTDLTFSDDKELVAKKYVDDYAILKASHNLSDGQTVNCKIAQALSTDDLVISLKGIDGNDPSATNLIHVRVDDTILEISSALSVTVPDSDVFSWSTGVIEANDGQLFVYAIDNNGTLQLGVSPDPTLTTVATNYYDAGGQTGSAGHTNIVMSGTRNATNSCRVIGRVNVQQATDHDWEAPATTKIIDRPIFETDVLEFDTSWTDLSVGNGTYTGKYRISGKEVKFSIILNFGSTSSITGLVSFTLPVKMDTDIYESLHSTMNSSLYYGASANAGFLLCADEQLVMPYAMVANATYLHIGGARLNTTIPITWTTGNRLFVDANYLTA